MRTAVGGAIAQYVPRTVSGRCDDVPQPAIASRSGLAPVIEFSPLTSRGNTCCGAE